MTAGQDMESVGQDRQDFYQGIADEVKAVSHVYHLSFVLTRSALGLHGIHRNGGVLFCYSV